MSKIDDLINKYCPNGVEHKTMGEVGSFTRGRRFVKDDIVEEGVPCIHYGEMYTHYGIWAKKAKSFLRQEVAAKLRMAHHGDVVIVAAGETVEDIGNGVAWLGDEDVVIHDACYIFSHEQDPKYVSYFLRTDNFHSQIKKNISSGKISSISSKGLEKAKIPIPPLEVQKIIADVLDSFTELEAELEEKLEMELDARKKQYEFYRNYLLSFEGSREVRWTTLGEVAAYSKDRIDAASLNHENYVGVDNILQNRAGKTTSNYVPTTGKLTQFNEGDVLLGNIRPYLKKIWQADRTGGTNGDVLVIKLHNRAEVMPRYLYQVLASDKFFDFAMKHSKGAKMPRGDKASILKYPIPIPSLSEQNRIVSILDKFGSLVNSVSESLPAEIKARNQQYEYYRNELLTFQESTV